ncbi:MAG: bifunctional demethylmenaquinone methyltransferase/2-methoxy-6-polyprenyl-1,4-benzoquinol methylase UbiE [Bacteriovorax sp.]|nr:bifunctional demethylmenaquinone methyltransferase/2-methoxy-6-polyprenyl-1,4-benzoquinol methylase UbiE [Bacteriovorax sp.]
MNNQIELRKKESYKIFNEIASTYDLLNHTLSFGIDIYWRKKLLKHLPQKDSINALDLATGTGDVPLTLVSDPRIKKITGIDLSKGMIDIGVAKVKKKGLEKKIFLMLGDGVNIPAGDNAFDLTTISFGIRNFSDPQKSLHDIHRVLKPDGRLMIMEFAIPKNPIIRAIYFFYFRYLLPKIGNLVSKHKDAYTYLNQSVEEFPYGENFLALMRNAGFKNLKMQPLTFGIAMLYIGDK